MSYDIIAEDVYTYIYEPISYAGGNTVSAL